MFDVLPPRNVIRSLGNGSLSNIEIWTDFRIVDLHNSFKLSIFGGISK
jgi:hypothetical protein